LASLRAYAEREKAGWLQRSHPHPKERPGFAGDSQKPPSEVLRGNTVRVSQLLPVLGDGGSQDVEADMRMGCGGDKEGWREEEHKRMSVGESGLRS